MLNSERNSGWHTEPPKDERPVLCCGEKGGMFIGRHVDGFAYGLTFKVQGWNIRRAVAWRELPEPYTEVDE